MLAEQRWDAALCASIADCAGQLPASEGRRSTALDVVSGLRISTAAAARIRDRFPSTQAGPRCGYDAWPAARACDPSSSTMAGPRCGPDTWPRPHEIHRLRCDRRHGLGIGRSTCLGVVRQVRLSVAPHVIEGAAALPKVKAGGQSTAYEAFRAANRLLDAVSLCQTACYGTGERTAGSVGVTGSDALRP